MSSTTIFPLQPGLLVVHLIRHASAVGGMDNSPLTEEGRAQGRAAALKLSDRVLSMSSLEIRSSHLERAIETVELVFKDALPPKPKSVILLPETASWRRTPPFTREMIEKLRRRDTHKLFDLGFLYRKLRENSPNRGSANILTWLHMRRNKAAEAKNAQPMEIALISHEHILQLLLPDIPPDNLRQLKWKTCVFDGSNLRQMQDGEFTRLKASLNPLAEQRTAEQKAAEEQAAPKAEEVKNQQLEAAIAGLELVPFVQPRPLIEETLLRNYLDQKNGLFRSGSLTRRGPRFGWTTTQFCLLGVHTILPSIHDGSVDLFCAISEPLLLGQAVASFANGKNLEWNVTRFRSMTYLLAKVQNDRVTLDLLPILRPKDGVVDEAHQKRIAERTWTNISRIPQSDVFEDLNKCRGNRFVLPIKIRLRGLPGDGRGVWEGWMPRVPQNGDRINARLYIGSQANPSTLPRLSQGRA